MSRGGRALAWLINGGIRFERWPSPLSSSWCKKSFQQARPSSLVIKFERWPSPLNYKRGEEARGIPILK